MFVTFFFIAAFGVSLIGIEIFRRWSLKHQIFDIPNERSSHNKPIPRGAGLIIVLVCLVFYILFVWLQTENFNWSYFSAAGLIAFISWLDDLYSIPSGLRLIVHSVAAVIFIAANGFFNLHFTFSAAPSVISYLEFSITFLWIVWLTNAYNFMDGIDGIAGLQSFVAGLGWLMAGSYLNMPLAGFYGGIIAFSSLGFLWHNWQPARVFMGDVGSAFLGFSFAVLPLLEKKNTASAEYLFVLTILMVWGFVLDTLLTVIKRIGRGEKFWRAHREHIYQRLILSGFSHQTVAVFYGVLAVIFVVCNLLWIKFDFQYSLLWFFLIGLFSLSLVLFSAKNHKIFKEFRSKLFTKG